MATASIAKQLQFDNLSNSDSYRTLQGFEALEQAILSHDTQMEFGATPNSNIVEVSPYSVQSSLFIALSTPE